MKEKVFKVSFSWKHSSFFLGKFFSLLERLILCWFISFSLFLDKHFLIFVEIISVFESYHAVNLYWYLLWITLLFLYYCYDFILKYIQSVFVRRIQVWKLISFFLVREFVHDFAHGQGIVLALWRKRQRNTLIFFKKRQNF